MNAQARERFWLPITIPVGALLLIGILTFSMSRILLNVPKEVATAVAFMTAISLLIACTLIALRPKLRGPHLMLMTGAALVPLLLGGLIATGVVAVEKKEEHAEPAGPKVAVAAKNIAFDVKELKIPAGKAFVLSFNNGEAAPHNVAILKAQGSSEALFRKQPIAGPKKVDWEVEPIEAGSYYFQCDVHPNMSGTVTAG
ncbi:MAG: cupredoxin domain-containing protein [Actinomycetota bacterium]